ncbi:hypothetical protein QFW77_08100 [Luteimonas sp. RD2P54]|uniref:Uncharacterized protein n=1 Tax=Luteimonas endophytica TaxID=3042023 RepID=A0ABT6J871_9GAMM|nr:hypothetical protein [Luteimonas endophytica]MDH5822949.1 hypothetical protein [Luteimonas endophytica]
MDERRDRAESGGWSAVFAALPQEAPPPGGWHALSARLERRRRPRWLPLAAVAAMLLAVALPWRLLTPGDASSQPARAAQARPAASMVESVPGDARLAALQGESAQLESLLPLVQDMRMSSGTAALLTGELERRLALLDAELAQPKLSPDREFQLWQARVDTLRALAGFEGTRRWMAANGDHYDPALVRVY